MEHHSLNVVYIKVTELHPYARNARTHSKKQIKQIACESVCNIDPV